MTNAPESRKTHVTRITGTNRDGERLDDIWVDVERIDVIKSASQLPSDQFQGVQRKLKWCDDPDGEDYEPDGTPSRLMTVIKVCDPETEDVDDPDEWVPVRVIRGMRSKGSVDSMGQGFMDRFVIDNDEGENTARIVEIRKISHCDTNIDDDAQAAFDGDPSRTQYVVDGQFYAKDLSTKDDDQYVDHEIITFLKNKGNVLDAMGLGRQTKLLNEYLIDESDPAKGEVIGASGINPPYRLDPFQNIVNVNFAPRVYVIITADSNAYATTDPDRPDIKILERRSDPSIPGVNGTPTTATLIECSSQAGDGFASLQTAHPTDAVTRVGIIVVPKTEAARVNWFDYVRWGNDRDGLPPRPFFWIVSLINAGAAVLMRFNITYTNHLIAPSPDVKNKMVQMYPMTGTHSYGVGEFTAGWGLLMYRTDKKGEGPTYGSPSAWTTDTIEGGGFRGLRFGTDPLPLINADVPFV